MLIYWSRPVTFFTRSINGNKVHDTSPGFDNLLIGIDSTSSFLDLSKIER
jgi:hypothetical protein